MISGEISVQVCRAPPLSSRLTVTATRIKFFMYVFLVVRTLYFAFQHKMSVPVSIIYYRFQFVDVYALLG